MSNVLDDRALVIPSGIRIEVDGEALSIGNQGDVVIRGQVSFQLKRLFSEQGSVILESNEPLSLSRVEAPNGDIRLKGQLTVQSLVAKRVALLGGSLTVRQIVAQEEVYLAGETLQADMVLAPRVDIDARLKGRATVLESKNDIGPNMLKGGFRLDEYLEIFPTGKDLLEQYPDVKARLEGWGKEVGGSSSSLLAELSAPVAAPKVEVKAPEAAPTRRRESNNEPIEISSAEVDGGAAKSSAQDDGGDDDGDDDLSETPREVVSPKGMSVEELYQHLSDSFLKIIGSYSDVKLPPPLSTLEDLIEERKFDAMKKQLTSLWNELLQYHKREGLHIANTVTQNIQEMRRLLADR